MHGVSICFFLLTHYSLLIFQKNLNICTNLINKLIIKDIRLVQMVCRGVQIGASPNPSEGGGTESPLLTSPLGEELRRR